MPILNVEFIENSFKISMGSKGYIPLKRGRSEVTAFAPGWAPLFVLKVGEDTWALALQSSQGAKATWFLDGKFTLITDKVDQLPNEVRRAVVITCSNYFTLVWQTFICTIESDLPEEVQSLLSLDRETIQALANLCRSQLEITTANILVPELSTALSPATTNSDQNEWSILRQHIEDFFAEDFFETQRNAIRDGELTFPSPVDGARIAVDAHSFMSDFIFSYRLYDRRYDLVWHVITTGHSTRAHAIFIPSLRFIIYPSEFMRDELLAISGGLQFEDLLFEHIVKYGDLLRAYLLCNTHRLALVYRGQHLGHHLWNELSGLDELARSSCASQITEVILLMNGLPEMFGSVDDLFPELTWPINRSISNLEALTNYVYETGLILLRPSRSYVSASLAKRILNHANGAAYIGASRVLHSSLQSKGYTFVLLGLRVENRTLVDLDDFCVTLSRHMRAKFKRVAIILDGHNSIDKFANITLPSQWEHIASRSPLDEERSIARRLKEESDGDGLVIVDTIGKTLNESLFWASKCAFFVAIWGAGLAKYRWIANKPGFVLTSRWNLIQRGDLQIYSSDAFMESPTSMGFANSSSITDLPNASLLVPMSHPSFHNFAADTEAVLEQIDKFLGEIEISVY